MASSSGLINLYKINYDTNTSQEPIAKYRYDWIESIVTTLKCFGQNKIHLDAACAVTKETQIIVCGPTRVGKSTLIKALTGCDVPTSSSLNPDTQMATAYRFENDSVVIWDTKGFENWDKTTLNNFWTQHFKIKKILPSFCLFCVGTGARADTILIKYMFDEFLFFYKIPVFWVITRGGTTDNNQLMSFIEEGTKMLGNITEAIDETIAWKTEKGFIIRVNSVPSEISVAQGVITIPEFGINTLRNILARNVSLETQLHLMKLYKNNVSFLSYVSAGLFEAAYKCGIPVTKYLDKEKREMFEKVAGKPIPFKWSMIFARAVLGNIEDFDSQIKNIIANK